MELSTQHLVRRLCSSIAREAVVDPQAAAALSSQLFDTAFSTLIGLNPEAEVHYVAPEDRAAATQAALGQACTELAFSSYGELAGSLQALAAALRRHKATAVLGTEMEQLTGAPPVLPLSEHDALLAFLLALQGSQLSVRRRQVTYQTAHEAASAGGVGTALPPLPGSAFVFCEIPDPYALTDVSSTTVALLPSECGFPTDPFAGAGDVQDLSSCMSSRPAWNPTAPAHARQPPSAAWLPVPPPLLEMRGDRRRGARPPPMGLPWSLLSMGEAPGAATSFQAALSSEPADELGDDSDLLESDFWAGAPGGGRGAPTGAAAAGSAGVVAVKVVSESCGLWSLEEADLARDALLALQGVHSALMRLRGALAVPAALPRRSIQGILARVAAAAELRQRLQTFVAAHLSGPAAAAGAAGAADPVLRAFAAALGEVLRQQVAALQVLEREGATSWVRSVEVGGKRGRQFHRKGLTLLQVALHTGRLQSQLQSLATLCWCHPVQQQLLGSAEEGAEPQANGVDGLSQLEWDSFPRGAALLSYLYQAVQEADDSQLPTLRLLFGRALAPYLAHLRAWAFSSAPLHREFGTRAEEAVAPCLEFLPPEEEEGGRRRLAAVPCDPPTFLESMHAPFMRAGAQLRLLNSLPLNGKELVAQLAGIAEHEAQSLGAAAVGARGGHATLQFGVVAAGPAGSSLLPGEAEAVEGSWLSLSGAGPEEEQSEAALLLTSSQLQQAVAGVEQADSERHQAVEGWLRGLALRRHQAEQAAAAEALGRTATIKERQQRAAARHAELAAQQRSSKAQLFRQQSDDLAARRALAAAQRTQQQAEERELLAQAALKEHSAAVAELAAALAGSSLAATASGLGAAMGLQSGGAAGAGPEATATEPQQQQEEEEPTGVRSSGMALPSWEAPAAAATAPPSTLEWGAAGAPAAVPAAGLAVPASSAAQAALEAEPVPGRLPELTVAPRRPQRERWQHVDAALGSKAPHVLPALAAFEMPEQAQRAQQQQEAPGERPAPLSAMLELGVVQSVLSQYRAVSQACVRLFLEELRVLEHLEALRRVFFMGAGDWADALVGALGAHADSLEPLSQHGLERLLQDAARGTSMEEDPYAARVRVRLLPGLSTVAAQVQAVSLPMPQRRSKALPRVPVSVVLPPATLDGLDCVALEYETGWPLATVITEDIMQGYAAVFSMLVRLKRVEHLLRALHAPLMLQPKSTADVLLSEEEADKAYRRLQQLRGFRHGAAQLVAAVQAFLCSRTSGQEWVQLLAKLMISSEQVALAVLSRGPNATVTGALSRMSSMAGSGSAAHRLVKLAKSLSRQGSRNLGLSRQGSLQGSLGSLDSLASLSQPGTPPAGAAAEGGAPRPGAGGPGPSRFAPSRLASSAALAAAAAAEGGGGGSAAAALTAAASQQQQQQPAGPALAGPAQAQPQRQRPGAESQGIADLQELLDLHRAYIRAASSDCLTFGGNPAVRQAVDAALQAALDFCLRLQAAVRLGTAGRTENVWVQVLRRDASWAPLAESMDVFGARLQALHSLLAEAGSRGVLAELALQLDYNKFYSKQEQRRRQAETAAE